MTNKKLEDMNTDELKEVKIEFAPGCFDNVDLTQEELDELVADIKNMVANGTLFENSTRLTEEDWDELPDEIKEQLSQGFENLESADDRLKRLN